MVFAVMVFSGLILSVCILLGWFDWLFDAKDDIIVQKIEVTNKDGFVVGTLEIQEEYINVGPKGSVHFHPSYSGDLEEVIGLSVNKLVEE